jgi:glycolate oxidase FAD binding subunit
VELAGEAPVVEATLARLGAELGAKPAPARVAEGPRVVQGASLGGRGIRVRVTALPTRVPAAVERLRAAGARILVYPGVGLVYAFLPLDPSCGGEDAGPVLAAAREAARLGGGGFVVEDAPLAVKRSQDVFGDEAPGALGIMRALKSKFDPAGVLNPGRFAGRL